MPEPPRDPEFVLSDIGQKAVGLVAGVLAHVQEALDTSARIDRMAPRTEDDRRIRRSGGRGQAAPLSFRVLRIRRRQICEARRFDLDWILVRAS